ncbi:MAG: hypothetical protein L3J14_03215 [Flavobacteriaceae bacterium]|nr:hypothetical protein [Flavobacteriaceae bacterium]
MSANGTIIVLAWPDTLVIKEGKWYDSILKSFGFLKNGFYKAGHAAILIINHETKSIEYFDFGRYQTPKKYGRVRDKITDPDVEIKIQAKVKNGILMNIPEILMALQDIEHHGEGKLIASVKKIKCFEKAYQKAKSIQKKEAIKYGPFNINGTNCSRFVAQVSLQSDIGFLRKLLLKMPYTVTPTPLSNVKVINDYGYYYEMVNKNIALKNNRLYFFKTSNK